MAWASNITELLWRSAWTVIPLALLVAAICRWVPCRPVTRHALWMIVLLSFVAPLMAPFLPLPESLLRGGALPTEEQDALAPACQPIVAEPGEKEGYLIVPSSQGPPELLSVLANGPHSVPDTADTAVPPSTNSLVWHGRVGRESTKADPDTHHSASTKTEGHSALTQDDPAQAVVSATGPPGREDAKPASTGSTWRAWVAALARVRDALLNLPTLPLRFWLIGIVGLIAVYVGGAVGFRLRLRRAKPAPKSVQWMVAVIARQFDLRCAPETVVLDEPISPMVWCGGRVRLVLPTGLWSQLDEVGRRAILCHELAHLRRRDHWVRWLELLISVVFWWHPLLWWVRHRMHEEADLCCDAWVTWLMPRRRRAYAEALLAAREHIGAGRRATPAIAVGVTTSGAKSFARRITMVMTQTSRPGISLAGIGLACTLLLAGWITTPAWSSPPKEKRDTARKIIVVEDDAAEHDKQRGERKIVVRKLGEEGGAADALGMIYAITGGDDEAETHHFLHQLSRSDDDDLEKRLARLEEAVEQLNKLLGARSIDIRIPEPPTPSAPPALPKPFTWRMPEGKTFKIGGGDDAIAIARGALWASLEKGETVVRTYELPEGKLKALIALMVRQDVPVLVSPKEDCIEVHATPTQHKTFKAFIELIHPSGKGSATAIEMGPHSRSVTINPSSFDAARKSYADAAFLLGADQKGHLESLDLHRDLLAKLHALGVDLPKLQVEVIAEASELLDEAEELHEHTEAFEHAKPPQETQELLRAVRELQQQAKQLAELARELEQKSKKADK